jgi:PQQ-like domain
LLVPEAPNWHNSRVLIRHHQRVLWVLLSVGTLCAGATAAIGDRPSRGFGDRNNLAGKWTTDVGGPVLAITQAGNTVYFGGTFQNVGVPSGQGVPVDDVRGIALRDYPKVAGTVFAVLSDGRGGWIVGGNLSYVGGTACHGLAHILRDGSVANWSPALDGPVRALAFDGSTLFVGGDFSQVDGAVRGHAAAFDVASGELLSWAPAADGSIQAIAVGKSSIFLGGSFTTIGGLPRHCLAEVTGALGKPTQWAPDPSATVRALLVDGQSLYVGGDFGIIASQGRSCLAAFSLRDHALTALSLQFATIPYLSLYGGPFVGALATRGGRLFAGGYFTHVDGQPHPTLIGIDLRLGRVAAWDPRVDQIPHSPTYCWALLVQGRWLYAGGSFPGIGGHGGQWVGAVDAESGDAGCWAPRPNGTVYALAGDHAAIYLGGYFFSVGDWQRRRGLAAINVRTGELLPWNPSPNGYVQSLLVKGNVVYAAGAFDSIGGVKRGGLAAVDAVAGIANDWNPAAENPLLASPAMALAAGPGLVYIGGWFTAIGGQSRSCLAAVDSASGLATDWNPSPDFIVNSLGVMGDTVYAGGWFSRIGGQSRAYLAALDAKSGVALPWKADADNIVDAVGLTPTTLYATGDFSTINGQPRSGLAAIDLRSGGLLPWNPGKDGRARALCTRGDIVYVGGDFGVVGGLDRHYVAAIDGQSARVLPWHPDANGNVFALDAGGSNVYVGGRFDHINGDPSTGICVLDAPALRLITRHFDQTQAGGPAPVQVRQNPIRSGDAIRFSIATDGPVKIVIFDLQGRRIASLAEALAGGALGREVVLETRGWPAGFYLSQVSAAGVTSTQKIVVVN